MRSIKLIDIECSYIIERLCQDVESINNTFGLSYDMTALPIYDDIMADSNRADLFCCKLEIIYLELTLFNLHSNPNGCNGVANSRSPYHSQQVVSIIYLELSSFISYPSGCYGVTKSHRPYHSQQVVSINIELTFLSSHKP